MDRVKKSHEIAFLVFMVLVAALGNQNPSFRYPQILWGFLALMVFNLGNLALLERRLAPKASAAVSIAANNLLVASILSFSGGHESYFWVLFLLPIFTACLLLERRQVQAVIAVEAAVLGAFYALENGGGWLALLEWSTKAATLVVCGAVILAAAQGERRAIIELQAEHERREHEKQEFSLRLQHADRLATVGTLVAGLAHDINNPLTAILGITQIHSSTALPPEVWKEDLQIIENAAQRCQQIVQGLLSFSRRKQAQPELHDPHELLRQCLALKKYDWTLHRIQIIEDFDPSAPKIPLVPAQFQQVLLNLLTNAQHAIRSVGQSGRIWVRTQRLGSHLRVAVEDDGPGIPAEVAARLFEPFFTTKPEGVGTGLGLSVSRQIIQCLGGTLSANSSSGKGARFIIELPLAVEAKRGVPPRAAPAASRTSARRRILVAEDEAPVVSVLKRSLGPLGHAVTVVGSFDEALRHLSQETPDLFLTDLRMPGMEARQFFDLLDSEGRRQQFPVIAISGSLEGTGLDALLRERGIPYLAKPFNLEQLRRAVGRALGHRQEAPAGHD